MRDDRAGNIAKDVILLGELAARAATMLEVRWVGISFCPSVA